VNRVNVNRNKNMEISIFLLQQIRNDGENGVRDLNENATTYNSSG
jgi:hypothetical protein